LNIASITKLAQAAFPLKVVIHKAIDETPDIIQACQQLIQTRKISTILTSGGKENAEKGLSVLKTLIDLSADKIEIMPAGKITNTNIEKLNNHLKAKAYHGRRIVGELKN